LGFAVDTLSPGTPLRLASEHRHLEGRLVALTVDSLRLRRQSGDTTLARSAIDSLWIRGNQSYDGTKAGLVTGLFLAALMLVAGHRGSQPESGSYGALFALTLGAGAFGLGVLIDSATPAPWIPLLLR
jgi:hypothetical protein